MLNGVMQAYQAVELDLKDEAHTIALASAIAQNSSVTTLNLSYNQAVNAVGLGALATALAGNSNVVGLNLAGCICVSDEAAKQMITALDAADSKCAMGVLQLAGCRAVGNGCATALAESFVSQGPLHLREVNLSGCSALGDTGVCAIARAVACAPHLTNLNLQGCVDVTDDGAFELAEGLRSSPALMSLDLSWCEAISNNGARELASALCDNTSLTQLQLACCVGITDDGASHIASALEFNHTLKTLDLSWITALGEPTLDVLTAAVMKNHTITTIILTGCKAQAIETLRAQASSQRAASRRLSNVSPPCARESSKSTVSAAPNSSPMRSGSNRMSREGAISTTSMVPLNSLLSRNRRRPATLASSALNSSPSGESSSGVNGFGRRVIIGPSDMLRTLRAGILHGAALYNAGDGDGCLRLFQQTAESVLANTRHVAVAEALEKVTSHYAPNVISEKLWILRTAFDALVDELQEQEDEAHAMAHAQPPPQGGGSARASRRSREPRQSHDSNARVPTPPSSFCGTRASRRSRDSGTLRMSRDSVSSS